ncbi:hypothetical protein CEXT_162571 [Caerostris extrusa]|uniref:Uncharacterized protein n=1 Tax=Caerostris extrusa TaxID=172846 RepID=A0AAV4MF12_CAEEX|nr:hypothetical protein CEXT_162571 [Caerostris extrusa]
MTGISNGMELCHLLSTAFWDVMGILQGWVFERCKGCIWYGEVTNYVSGNDWDFEWYGTLSFTLHYIRDVLGILEGCVFERCKRLCFGPNER